MNRNSEKASSLELLSPAKDLVTGKAAIDSGADAVYIGPESFGARQNASNSVDDIRRLVDYAVPFGVKIYSTLNTILYSGEINSATDLAWRLWEAGVDALIVQDLGLLRANMPPIALHASTQCDIRDAAKARMLSELGFERIVVARELNPREISEIHRAIPDTEIEAFVHGALCVSYSGDCHAGYVLKGRSANRGECPQICRLKFSLTDSAGRRVAQDAHFLSLKDMKRLDSLGTLADAGVRSFKIEGRLKEVNYVRVVTSAYRRALDELISGSEGKYCRSSWGTASDHMSGTSLEKVFNREFTSYYFNGKGGDASERIGRTVSPKWLGEKIGAVAECQGKQIKIDLLPGINLNNGDGLIALPESGEPLGFRVNRAEGNVIYTATEVRLVPGTTLRRNRDMGFDTMMQQSGTERKSPVRMCFDIIPESKLLRLEISDSQGHKAYATAEAKTIDKANKSQEDARKRVFSKCGGTPFTLEEYKDSAVKYFVPVSELGELRRKALELLGVAIRSGRCRTLRKPVDVKAGTLNGVSADYHWNIANPLSESVINSLGGKVSQESLETGKSISTANIKVMTTRYCLRRQLGACLMTPGRDKLPRNLFLKAPGISLRLAFDCANCRMEIFNHRDNSDCKIFKI